MKQFRLVQPDDAEVLRDGSWIRYDHTSLVICNVFRLVEGDVVCGLRRRQPGHGPRRRDDGRRGGRRVEGRGEGGRAARRPDQR